MGVEKGVVVTSDGNRDGQAVAKEGMLVVKALEREERTEKADDSLIKSLVLAGYASLAGRTTRIKCGVAGGYVPRRSSST